MTDNGTESNFFLFVASANMWPRQINAAYPGAQFIARAKSVAPDGDVAPNFRGHVGSEVWGLLVSAAGPLDVYRSITVTTDDGRMLEAWVFGELLAGDPQSLYMASRYWELPPAYIQLLRSAIVALGLDAADEEPRDDGALGPVTAPQS